VARSRALVTLLLAAVASYGVIKGVSMGWRKFTERPREIPVLGHVGPKLSKEQIAKAIGALGLPRDLPRELEVSLTEGRAPEKVSVQYGFDPALQESMETFFKSYRPDYGAFVALDPVTGRVLAMVSYADKGDIQDNLALRATFPSASIFKVVTAAAAIAEKQFSPDTVIPFQGSNHTLYKRNVLGLQTNRWTRYMTLRDAFALSVNPVFGRLGAITLGSAQLTEYAHRFGFNQTIGADFPMQDSIATIAGEGEQWSLAETASGFTRETRMSPMQGALIAAAIVNEGVMMEPHAVDAIHTHEGVEVYRASPKIAQHSIDAATARSLRNLMQETVDSGTSRNAFKKFFVGPYAKLEVGGKTGSLTGDSPPGKYDWFVGYAKAGSQKFAFCSLAIHGAQWRVKSSFLARLAIEQFFSSRLEGSRDDVRSQTASATTSWNDRATSDVVKRAQSAPEKRGARQGIKPVAKKKAPARRQDKQNN
jgi:peptidoglycan glycosyltransferase